MAVKGRAREDTMTEKTSQSTPALLVAHPQRSKVALVARMSPPHMRVVVTKDERRMITVSLVIVTGNVNMKMTFHLMNTRNHGSQTPPTSPPTETRGPGWRWRAEPLQTTGGGVTHHHESVNTLDLVHQRPHPLPRNHRSVSVHSVVRDQTRKSHLVRRSLALPTMLRRSRVFLRPPRLWTGTT